MNHVMRRREQISVVESEILFCLVIQLGGCLPSVQATTGVKHGMNGQQARVGNVRTCRLDVKGEAQVDTTISARVPMRGTGAEHPVVVMKGL